MSAPESVKRDTDFLLAEMSTIAEEHAAIATSAEQHIAVLMSWVTVAAQALQVAQTLVPVAAKALTARGVIVSTSEQESWLKKLSGDPAGLLAALKAKLPT